MEDGNGIVSGSDGGGKATADVVSRPEGSDAEVDRGQLQPFAMRHMTHHL